MSERRLHRTYRQGDTVVVDPIEWTAETSAPPRPAASPTPADDRTDEEASPARARVWRRG